MIHACLQGAIGRVYADHPDRSAAAAFLGDFVFYADTPSDAAHTICE